jgi:uracil-DNA glycosylase
MILNTIQKMTTVEEVIGQIHTSWVPLFEEIGLPLLEQTLRAVQQERDKYEPDILIFPPPDSIWRLFQTLPLPDIRVIVIGQDPYIHQHEAMGFSFSIPQKCHKIPPSLQNIFKELGNDCHIYRTRTDLTDWVQQGVFLINQTLTVRQYKSNSHATYWKPWMNAFWKIFWQTLHHNKQSVVVWCWGKYAEKALTSLPKNHTHFIHKSPHPSPLSSYRGFFGSKPFSLTNEFLQKNGQEPIHWGE